MSNLDLIPENHLMRSLYNDIYGLENISHQLLKSIYNYKFHHAHIIYGPSGIGKSAFAMRLAYFKIISMIYKDYQQILEKDDNILNKNFYKNFENFPAHKQFIKLYHPDFLYISSSYKMNSFEEKKNKIITIDEVRTIQEFVRLSFSMSPNRVILIDDVEKMNNQAFNAFLKVLEEPNDKVFFIMTASNVLRLPKTIISRCKKVKLKQIHFKDYEKALFDKINKEKLSNSEIEKLYIQTHGNIRLSQYLLSLNIEEVDNFVIKILNGSLEAEDALLLKNYAEDTYFYEVLKDLVFKHLENRINIYVDKYGIHSKEMSNFLSNFDKLIKFLNKSEKSYLDSFLSLASISGIH